MIHARIAAACMLALLAASGARADALIRIHPIETFLHVSGPDRTFANSSFRLDPMFPAGLPPALPARPISLEALGLREGDTITLTRVGNYSFTIFGQPDTVTGMIGLFSSTDEILPPFDSFTTPDPARRFRVPGALDAGPNVGTGPTLFGTRPDGSWTAFNDPDRLMWAEPTDIPEDFAIPGGAGLTVTIPAGARYLFLCVPDVHYNDNWDPDANLGVLIHAPAIVAPPDLTVPEGSPLGTSVALGTPLVTDTLHANLVVSNDAPAQFPVGATTVTWTVTDPLGASTRATQNVTVVPGSPSNQIDNLDELVEVLVGSGSVAPELESSLSGKLDAAAAALARGNPNDAKVALNELGALVNQINAQTDKKITPEAASAMLQRIQMLVAALS